MDPLSVFINETYLPDANAKLLLHDIYSDFIKWMEIKFGQDHNYEVGRNIIYKAIRNINNVKSQRCADGIYIIGLIAKQDDNEQLEKHPIKRLDILEEQNQYLFFQNQQLEKRIALLENIINSSNLSEQLTLPEQPTLSEQSTISDQPRKIKLNIIKKQYPPRHPPPKGPQPVIPKVGQSGYPRMKDIRN